jgi:hypothetical protein
MVNMTLKFERDDDVMPVPHATQKRTPLIPKMSPSPRMKRRLLVHRGGSFKNFMYQYPRFLEHQV